MRFKYCPKCGKKLSLKELGDEGEMPYCISCEEPYMDSFNTCVIVTIINGDKIALVKQDRISETNWILVAGYVKEGETAEETVSREVEEETGISVKDCKYISSYFHENGDNLMLGFIASVVDDEFSTSSEIDDIKWFKIEESEKFMKKGSIAHQHFCKVRNYLNKLD